MKTIKDAVIELGGKWPAPDLDKDSPELGVYYSGKLDDSRLYSSHGRGKGGIIICTRSEFECAAKLLGYINGYRWGVEYPTNGKRPDLPDDVEVWWKNTDNDEAFCKAGELHWGWESHPVTHFKITDPRYKQSDEISEISESKSDSESVSEKPESKQNAESVSEWFENNAPTVYGKKDENNWHERGELPPVGEHCEYKIGLSGDYSKCTFVGINSNKNFVIEVYGKYSSYHESQIVFRPIRTEREKVIEAAFKVASGGLTKEMYSALYNAGMLVLPPKKSDTED